MKDISDLDMELVQRILRSEQTFFIQLVSVSILAVVVFVALQICNKVVERVTRGAAYVPTVIAVGKHKLKNMLGMDVSDEKKKDLEHHDELVARRGELAALEPPRPRHACAS